MARRQERARDRNAVSATDIENTGAGRKSTREGHRFGYARLVQTLRCIPFRDQVVFTHCRCSRDYGKRAEHERRICKERCGALRKSDGPERLVEVLDELLSGLD